MPEGLEGSSPCQTPRTMFELVSARPRLRLSTAIPALLVLLGSAAPAIAETDLLAFTRAVSERQGTFEAGGVKWTCGGELCSGKGPDDGARWPDLCAAFVREAGPVAAFGSIKVRFEGAALATCNEASAAVRTAPPAAAPQAAPSARPASPPAEAVPAPAPAARAESGGAELCNGRDDDGDGAVDEGVSLRVWEDRDHDLFGDPRQSREICPHQLAPGLVVNDYDCDDADPARNPGRANCG